jgi:hypothetical protein
MQTTIDTTITNIPPIVQTLEQPTHEQSNLRDILALESVESVKKDGEFLIIKTRNRIFTPDDIERFRRNYETLVASLPKRSEEEWQEIFARSNNFPVATEDEIKLHDEACEEMRKWR